MLITLIAAEDFFETADYTDDADLFLPQMPLIYAEDFFEPLITQITLISNKLHIQLIPPEWNKKRGTFPCLSKSFSLSCQNAINWHCKPDELSCHYNVVTKQQGYSDSYISNMHLLDHSV